MKRYISCTKRASMRWAFKEQCRCGESNSGQHDYESCALPLSYTGTLKSDLSISYVFFKVKHILFSLWEVFSIIYKSGICKVFVEIRTTPIVGAGLRGMPKGIPRDPALQWETPRNHCKLNLYNQIFTHPLSNNSVWILRILNNSDII